jgi:hypothetical protein
MGGEMANIWPERKNKMTIAKDKKEYVEKFEILMAALPFFIFFVITTLNPIDMSFSITLIEGRWSQLLALYEYVMILATIVLFFFKGFNYKWYFVFLGLSISLFYTINANYQYWLVDTFFEKHIHYIINEKVALPYHSIEQILILMCFSILLIVLFFIFKVNLSKLFLLIFASFFSFCYIRAIFHHSYPFIGSTSFISINYFHILNSGFSIIFLALFLNSKSTIKKMLLFLIYLVANFLALYFIDIFQISKDYLFKGHAKIFFEGLGARIIIYTKYFLIKSNFLYFIAILIFFKVYSSCRSCRSPLIDLGRNRVKNG